MARDFSEDGAIGAMTGDVPGAGAATSSLTPSIMNGFTTQDKPTDNSASPVSTMPLTLGDNSGAISGVGSDSGDGEGLHTTIGGNDRSGFGGGFTPMGVR